MSDVWEAYFKDDIYLVKANADKMEACKQLLKNLQYDNDCVYKLPQNVSIRETDDGDWEGFIVKSLN